MKEEIEGLVKRKTWEMVPKDSIGREHPKGELLPVTWVFKIKRFTDYSIRKFKARLCVRGDVQKDKAEDPLDTYAPVVQWSTVRLLLILTQLLKLETLSVDFSNAFAQADMPKDKAVYLHLPRGFQPVGEFAKEMVLWLKKSLYGQAEAPKLWYEKLKKGLKDRGFETSQIDPCLFISKKVIVVAYVDDCLFFAKDRADIDQLIQSFKDDGDEYNWELKSE